MFGLMRRRPPAVAAFEQAQLERVGTAGNYKVIRNGFHDDEPDTYRLFRRLGISGWILILTLNARTGAVAHSYCETDADVAAIRGCLSHAGIENWLDLAPKATAAYELRRIQAARGTARRQDIEKERKKRA